MPAKVNADLSASPVMIPGSAKGKTRKSEMDSRPKKRNRWTPKAASEPRTIERTVAATPALTDRMSAARTCGSLKATENQWKVKPASGQLCTFEESKA